jgi:hypothetical protein
VTPLGVFGVDAHPHTQHERLRPALLRERTLRSHRRCHGQISRREHSTERVPDRLEDMTAV